MSKPVALTIAGFDPTGGAGLQADLKSFAAFGVYGVSVAAVLTAQNASRFEVEPVAPDFISAQIDTLFEAFDIDVIKIGMLGGADAVGTVVAALMRHNAGGKIPVILDPVIRASNDGLALDPAGVDRLRAELIPLCTLVKPNLMEAALLLDCAPATDLEQMRGQGAQLLALGSPFVLLSGGHLAGKQAVDLLFERGGDGQRHQLDEFSAARVNLPDVHGTGCTLSAAIAAGLASGADMRRAVKNAKTAMAELMGGKMQPDKAGNCVSLDHMSLTLNKNVKI